jgi:hypothetical protein
MDALLADVDQVFRAAQHARRRAADLDMGARTDRLQLELRVEGRHFENADIGHAEHVGDAFDRGLGDPAVLLLRAHEQRDDRRLLAALGILLDRCLGPGRILLREGEAFGLDIVFG